MPPPGKPTKPSRLRKILTAVGDVRRADSTLKPPQPNQRAEGTRRGEEVMASSTAVFVLILMFAWIGSAISVGPQPYPWKIYNLVLVLFLIDIVSLSHVA